jgi:hypothetical protein
LDPMACARTALSGCRASAIARIAAYRVTSESPSVAVGAGPATDIDAGVDAVDGAIDGAVDDAVDGAGVDAVDGGEGLPVTVHPAPTTAARTIAAGSALPINTSAQKRAHGGGKRHDPAIGVKGDENRACRDETCIGRSMGDDIVERQRTGLDLGQRRLDPNDVIVTRRGVTPHSRLRHGQGHPVPLELRVGAPEGPDVVGPSDFAPDEIIGVIHDPHLIGFRIPDA